MQLLTSIDRTVLSASPLLAESGEFGVYEMGSDTYALVHRHKSVPWQGFTVSGEGLFRIAELLASATRTLYRGKASELSPKRRDAT